MPCYLADNVDRQRGKGVFDGSIRGLKHLNALGYGRDPALVLNLVYNPQGPSLPPAQGPLEADYKRIAAYSPYDNIRAQAYPAVLVLAGLSDPRVTYWEPAKWVAKLRATKLDANPIIFRTNMEAGHGGASGRFERLHETAFAMAFALKVAGAAQTPPSASLPLPSASA